jgi:Tfp pilus assembly protein PilX
MSRQAKSRRTSTRPAKPRWRGFVLVCVIVFAVLLLLLRMVSFVHGRH